MTSSDRDASATPDAGEPAELRCAAHPGTVTYLRCQQCGTPICPRCLVMTPVGAKCRNCARTRLQPVFRVSPLHLLAALVTSVVGGFALGLIGSFLVHVVPLVGFLVQIFFPFVAGLLLGDAVARVSRYRHHFLLKVWAGLGVIVSYFTLALGDFILINPLDFLRSGLLGPFLGRDLVNFVINPIEILFLGLGIWIAVQRVG